jgi:hypothetical protein
MEIKIRGIQKSDISQVLHVWGRFVKYHQGLDSDFLKNLI